MSEVEDRLPGVTFNVKYISTRATAIPGRMAGKVELDATITDRELWEVVKKKLDGLKVYASGTYKDEMIDALGEELAGATNDRSGLERALDIAFVHYLSLLQEVAEVRAERDGLRTLLSALGSELGLQKPKEYDGNGGCDAASAQR